MATPTATSVTSIRLAEAKNPFIIAFSGNSRTAASYERQNARGRRCHKAEQNDVDRQVEQRTMPQEAIQAASIQYPLQQNLKQKSDGGNNHEDGDIYAVNVQLPDHGTLSRPGVLAPWLRSDLTDARSGVGQYGGASG